MEDDFYATALDGGTAQSTLPNLVLKAWNSFLSAPLLTILIGLASVVVATRWLSGRASVEVRGKKGMDLRTVQLLPYWVPLVGHNYSIFQHPITFLTQIRDQSLHGIFALKLGGSTHNFVTKPSLQVDIFKQNKSSLIYEPVSGIIWQKFFDIPKASQEKYAKIQKELSSKFSHPSDPPYLSSISKNTVRGLEDKIPQMVSFIDTDVDLQPWEHHAGHRFISNTELEIDLMSLIADILGNVSISAVFGKALLEKHPNIPLDVRNMDAGIRFFLMGLPPLTPGIMTASQARNRVLRALDGLHYAFDATVEETHVDFSWGDLDDVSEFIMQRHAFFRENGLNVKERPDIIPLWTLSAKAPLIAFWHLLYILSTPNLLSSIMTETSPYTKITKPFSIGSFSEAPKLSVSPSDLLQKCPLLKSTYYETLRLVTNPVSTRQLTKDIEISDNESENSVSFLLKNGEFVTIPHALHHLNPVYFKNPETFNPERFLVTAEDGTVSAEMGDLKLLGEEEFLCDDRELAENTCLSFVAGILAMWEFRPVDAGNKEGKWIIPETKMESFVARPGEDVRVRIKRRVFEWEGKGEE